MSCPSFTLWFSILFPGRPLDYSIHKTVAPRDMEVFDFTITLASELEPLGIQANRGVYLYKAPNVSIQDLPMAQISMFDLGKSLVAVETLETIFGPQPAEHALHFIVFCTDMPMPVCCWVRGTNTPFRLEVQRNESVHALLGIVKESMGLSAALERLELYRFSFHDDKELERVVHTEREGELLSKIQDLHTAFYRSPLTKTACVVVEVVGRKRARSWNVLERTLKRQKRIPSRVTTSEYYKLQTDMRSRFLDQRFALEHRSSDEASLVPDRELPPLELLYPGFGQFLDTYRAKRHSDCTVGSPKLREHVELFAERMSRVCADDFQRKLAGGVELDQILSGLLSPRQVRPSSVDTELFDGRYLNALGPYGVPIFLAVFENEAAGSEAIPIAQLSMYYERIIGKMAEAKPDLVERSRFPVLGLTVIGPAVTFYAMAYVGSTAYCSLTPGLSCVLNAGGGDDRRALHAAFTAANELLARIEEDAVKLSNVVSPPPFLVDHFFPDIEEIPRIQDPSTSIKFKIFDLLHKSSGLVYRATSGDGRLDLVIKITSSYSTELHQFCAERGHAPVLHAVKRVPGNMVVVAMDYLEGDFPGPEGSQAYRDMLAQQLRQLVREFHHAGYVHGDLRVPNLYCVGDTIMLLDFDWGGKVGEAYYPPCLLNPQLKEGRDMSDLKITPEDDDRVLESTLKSIGCS